MHAHAHARAPCPGHASYSLHPPPSLPLPSPQKKIPSLIHTYLPNKVPRQLRGAWELGSSGEELPNHQLANPFHLPSVCLLFFLLFLLLVSPGTLPCLGSELVCLFVCLSTLLTCLLSRLVLSCSVLSCSVPHASFILFQYSASPNTNLLCPPSSIVTVTITVHRRASSLLPCFVSQFAACSLHQPLPVAGHFTHMQRTSSPTRPPSKLASHCRAAAARELELGFGGAGLGQAAQSSCQLMIRSRTSDKHSSSMTGTETGFTRAGFPFPHPTCMMESATSAT